MANFKLKRLTVFAYVLPTVPLAALGLPLVVYLPPLYAEQTTLTVGLVGTLFFAARLFDVVTDPMFGIASDRTQTRFGRRRPWMLLAVPILMLSVYMVFNPPKDAGVPYLLGWMFCLYVGYTLATLSHLSWGAELSENYDERSRVQGWREFALIVGMLTVLAMPAAFPLFGFEQSRTLTASAMSAYIIIMLPITILTAVLVVPERKELAPAKNAASAKAVSANEASTNAASANILKQLFGPAMANPYLLRTLTADLLYAVGPAITGALYLWLAQHALQLPEYQELILLIYFVSAVIGMPLWIEISYRIGKHNAFSLALVFSSLALLAYWIIEPGNLISAIVVTTIYGIAYGAGSFLLRTIMADVADHEKLETGVERTGFYFSLLTLTGKLGLSFGTLIAYNFLDYVGFDPKGEVTQSAQFWLLFVFVVPPALAFGLAALTMWRFPLNKAVQQDMRRRIEEQQRTDARPGGAVAAVAKAAPETADPIANAPPASSPDAPPVTSKSRRKA